MDGAGYPDYAVRSAGRLRRPPLLWNDAADHFIQRQWSMLSDQAMEEALHDMPLLCEFA